MSPTNEQIIAEANRRRNEKGMDGFMLADFIIEVMREGWKPPEPVDRALLVAREVLAVEWEKRLRPHHADAARKGRYDTEVPVLAAVAAYKHQEVHVAAAIDLLDAGSQQTAILREAQEILTRYLVPDGLDASRAIGALLALLDGPEQRFAQFNWDVAVRRYHKLQKETNPC